MLNRHFKGLAASALIVLLLMTGCGNAKNSAPQLSPQDAPKVREEAVELLANGKVEDALAKLDQVAKVTPEDMKAQFMLGVSLYSSKKFEEAVAVYKKIIAKEPNHFEAYNNMGNAYRDMGKRDEAIAAYKKAIELNPKFSYSSLNLSLVQSDAGDHEAAVVTLENALAQSADNVDIMFQLALEYQASGKKDKALKLAQELQKTMPNNGAINQLVQDLLKAN